MSYLGPSDIQTRVAWADVYSIPEYSAQTITGSGAFVYTLNSTPTGVNSIDVSIDGVTQVPTTDFTIDANVPNISFTTALNSGEKALVVYRSKLPPQGLVGTGVNVGDATGIGIFKTKDGNDLEFKKLKAGTGISLDDGNTYADTITITSSGSGGSTQNTWRNLAITGTANQSSLTADIINDTLTLHAGAGMAITTDTSNDTITFTSTGGGSGGGLSAFLALADTPNSYANNPNYIIKVNSITNAIEFVDISGDVDMSSTGAVTVQDSFVTGKTEVTSVTNSDVVLLHDGSSYKKITAGILTKGEGSTTIPEGNTKEYWLLGAVTTNTFTEIFVGGVTNTRISIPENSTVTVRIMASARRTGSSTYKYGGWEATAMISNDAGVTALNGTVSKTAIYADTNYDIQITADDTNDSLKIEAKVPTGEEASFFVTANLTIATSATVVTASEDRGLVTESSTQNSSIHTSGNDAGAITDSNIVESDDFGSI
jgi:hypothetical protein